MFMPTASDKGLVQLIITNSKGKGLKDRVLLQCTKGLASSARTR